MDGDRVGVRALGYVGMRSPELEAWPTFAEALGARATFVDPDTVQVKVDDHVQRLTIERSDANAVAFLGWELRDHDALATAVEVLERNGFDPQELDADIARVRGVDAGIVITDPAGIRTELYTGLAAEPGSATGLGARFVTGELGVGHVVLIVPDGEAYLRYVLDLLGLRVSDSKGSDDGGMSATFLHCNPRHHSLAVVGKPGVRGLHHVMLEVASIDDVGPAYDRCSELGVVYATLGRHTNDHMVSFYARTPSGFAIEYGFGGRLVDDATWVPEVYDAASTWGHKPVGTGSVGAIEILVAASSDD